MADPRDPMRMLLEHARPAADARDLPALQHILAGIAVDPLTKAQRLLEASYALSSEGEYVSARTAALLALATGVRNTKVLPDMAARLRTFNEAGLLLELIKGAGPVDRLPIPVLLAFAAQLSYLNCQQEALRMVDEARRADPDYPPTLLARGQILTYLGRLDEAAASIEACITRAPEIAQAHWFLAHVRKASSEHNQVARLRRGLGRPALPPNERASLAFALHKELDDLGDHDSAWQAVEVACKAKRSTLKYTPSESRALVDALVRQPAAAPLAMADRPARTPIFIVGMHRSGTTLLEQLLDASQDVAGIGELYDFTSAMRHATDHHCRGVIDQAIVQRASGVDLHAVGRTYLEGVEWRLGGAPFFTDKLPSNFLNVGFICRALPHARILHMVRDPVETCFSNLREMFSDANPYSYDQAELADYFIQYRRLMTHWHAAYPGRVLDVSYEALTRDPEAVMRGVADFCGIGFVEGMKDPRSSGRAVATASAVQVREGVVRRAVPKWHPYAERLKPLASALRAGGVELPGYPP